MNKLQKAFVDGHDSACCDIESFLESLHANLPKELRETEAARASLIVFEQIRKSIFEKRTIHFPAERAKREASFVTPEKGTMQ